jgi:hypothetical protein
MSLDSSVGIATGYGLHGRGLIPDRGSGAHPASYTMDNAGFFPGVKRPGSESDNSPPSSAEVKNDGAIPPLPHMSSWHSA